MLRLVMPEATHKVDANNELSLGTTFAGYFCHARGPVV